jgi:diguanylate cyclase (GGDEF)-like protein
MDALLPVFVTSIPLLIAAVLSLGAFLVSLSFRFRRSADKRLLTSYRIALLLTGVQLLVYAIAHNRWVDPSWALRLAVAGLAFYPLLMLSFRRGFQREADARNLVDSLAAGFGALLCAWMVFDTSGLVRSGGPSPLGFGRLEAGRLFWVYQTLVNAATFSALGYVYVRARGNAKNQARRFALSGAFIVAVIAFDLLTATLGWNVPPLAWIGTLVLVTVFIRDAIENYSAALSAWRATSDQRDELYKRLIRDPLTGLCTRTHGIETLEKVLKTGPACVIFLDLDGFKTWNDRYGHAAGDRVLVAVANAIKESIRVADVPARYAGDEFFVILQDAQLPNALEVAAAVQTALRGIDFKVGLVVSGSIGVTVARRGEDADRVINRADALAYQAKHGGKNRIVGDNTEVPVA